MTQIHTAIHGPSLEFAIATAAIRMPGTVLELVGLLAGNGNEIEASPPGSDVYIENRTFVYVGVLLRKMTIFPGWAGIFTIFFPENTVGGRRVYFVSEEAVIASARHGRRTASLLVASAPALNPNAEPAAAVAPAPPVDR